MSNAIHANENYHVRINDDGSGYEVINDQTGVAEFTADQLPECIFAAENLNVVLEFKTYEWIRKAAQKKSAAELGLVQSNSGGDVTPIN